MPSVTVELKAKVAIGILGVAVMELSEHIVDWYGCSIDDIEKGLVERDIKDWGVDDWADHCLSDVPADSGIYEFVGKASFDEDSSDYSVTCSSI